MIKTIIIEDEINARTVLKKMLHILEPNIHIIAETAYVSEAIELINQEKPNLVFMDIELEDGTSLDILKKLENINFKIIFTTAYNQYAINAFKFSAIDYLLKPIDPIELEEAIKRAIISIENKNEHLELLNVLKNNIEKKEQKIVLKTTEQRYVIPTNDIIRLEEDGAYTLFITTNQKIIISKNLKYYQDLLTTDFVRCHQSHLINTKHIIAIEKNGKLKLSNTDLVPISVRKKAEVIELISKL
jgi:two-component system LytT family response regulator